MQTLNRIDGPDPTHGEPEHELLAALLIQSYHQATGPDGWVRDEARLWFLGTPLEERDARFTFEDVCTFLSLSTEAIRDAVAANRPLPWRNHVIRMQKPSTARLSKHAQAIRDAQLARKARRRTETFKERVGLLATEKGETKMPRMTSTLETVQDRPLVAKDTYVASIDKIAVGRSKRKDDGTGDNPMLLISFKIRGGQFDGCTVPSFPDNVMIGGTQKDGQPMNCFRLAQLIEAFKLPWADAKCGSGDRVVRFLRGDKDNGLPLGKYHCPDCKAQPTLDYDTDAWIGAQGKVAVNVEKAQDGSDRERNIVEGYASLD